MTLQKLQKLDYTLKYPEDNMLIKKLHDQFLQEAKQSPVLLSDLANLEKYISESYSERSLIELIQNADDANSTKFYISIISSDAVLVANNGDYFNEEDVTALCRSGSSTKKRKSNTIGYRGIGFKSVVNYTNNVHIYSGDLKFSFSKELTRKDLPEIDNVPLVRIPHCFAGDKYINEIQKVIDKGYTTVFIFETKLNSLIDEIDSFNESCLLFLSNLEFFKSKTNKINEINAKRLENELGEIITISSLNATTNDWLILTDYTNNEKVNVAFSLTDNNAQKLAKEESVIHSFMPTKNKFCIPCKVNGDFSTDPSRTKIVIDEETTNVMNNIANFFSKIISNIVKNKQDSFRLISIISLIFIDPISKFKSKDINDQFIEQLKNQIIIDLNKEDILIQPEWLSEDSFLEIYGKSDKTLITDTIDEKIIGIKKLLSILGFEEPEYNSTMKKASENKYSEDTRVDLAVKSVEKTRFTATKEDKESINNAYLIESEDTVEKTKNLNSKPSQQFISKVEEKLNDTNDLKWFTKKFNIKYELPEEKIESTKKIKSNVDAKTDIVSFKKNTKLTKWRSIETNVIEILKGFDYVKSVEDVSLMNVGYDAKVITNNNEEQFYEIKSVNSLGDPIKITNNEYTHAHKYKDKYYLAIAAQQEDFIELCIIANPIDTINLTKRIVQVEWICNEYEGKYSKTYFD